MVRRVIFIELIFSALVLFASARQWAKVTYSEAGFPTVSLSLSGRQLDPLQAGLAVATLTAALGIMVTRKITRRIIGLFIFIAGLAIAFNAFGYADSANSAKTVVDQLNVALGRSANENFSVEYANWWQFSLVAGIVIATCGFLVLSAKRIEKPLASRYERAPERTDSNISDWHALDQGIDPTE